jgi:hypothetical protein
MAQMIISLRCDPVTGKKDIVVKLDSDPDVLPLEHEQQHRALVDRLIEGGVLKAEEIGKIIVERPDDEKRSEAPAEETSRAARQPRAQGT